MVQTIINESTENYFILLTAKDIDPYTEMEACPDGNDLLVSFTKYSLYSVFVHVYCWIYLNINLY